jgi:DNA-binding beta-propeller fold protein YncE
MKQFKGAFDVAAFVENLEPKEVETGEGLCTIVRFSLLDRQDSWIPQPQKALKIENVSLQRHPLPLLCHSASTPSPRPTKIKGAKRVSETLQLETSNQVVQRHHVSCEQTQQLEATHSMEKEDQSYLVQQLRKGLNSQELLNTKLALADEEERRNLNASIDQLKLAHQVELQQAREVITQLQESNYSLTSRLDNIRQRTNSWAFDRKTPSAIFSFGGKGAAQYTSSEKPTSSFGSFRPIEFDQLGGVAVDRKTNNIIVADSLNDRIQVFNSKCRFLFKFGETGTGEGQLRYPVGIAVNPEGNIFVSEYHNHRVSIFTLQGKFIRQNGNSGSNRGEFAQPCGMTLDCKTRNLLVVEMENHRVQVCNQEGRFLRMIGKPGNADGQFSRPSDVAVDPFSGNIIVADYLNHRIQVFDSETRFLFKFGEQGKGEGQFYRPHGVVVDSEGNILVTEFSERIQVFDPRGRFIRSFGSGQLKIGRSMAFDESGNLVVR